MQTVSAAYKEQMRRPLRNHSYVRVSYGVFNLLAGQQATFADSGHTAYGNLNLNDDLLPDRDYATFEKDYWRADGSQLILPATGPYNYDGFVSSAVSSMEDNTFATNPTITVTFSDPQDIFGLTFTFPAGQIPQEIKVNGTTYNPDSELYVMPDRLEDVTQITIEFVKAPAPGRRVRLNRLQFGQTVVFQNRQLVKTSFESSIDFLSLSLTQKKFTFTIDNKDQVYNPLNPQGLYAYLEAQQPLETEYGYELDDGTIEWVQGDSTVSESTPIAADAQASFSAVDALTNLTGMFYHGLYRPTGISLYDLAEEVLIDAGVEHYVIDDHLKTVYTKAALPVATHRECLQIIANAGQCILYTDRRGYIKLEIALDPTITIGDNGHTAFSDSDSAYNDMDLPTAKYADFLPDSWRAAGAKILLPSVGPYIRTGFVSDSICDKDGSMTDTQSGSRIEFRHAIDSALQSLTVTGKTIQDGSGDPSPDNVRPLHGTTALTISDGGSQSQTIAIPQPLYSLSDGTADVYEIVAGQGTARARSTTYDGSADEAWIISSTNTVTVTYAIPFAPSAGAGSSLSCNRFPWLNDNASDIAHVRQSGGAGTNLVVYMPKTYLTGWDDAWTDAQKIAALKSWLAANPVVIVYKLATPQAISGTAQTIRTYYPYTQIINDAGAEMEAVAPAKTPVFFWTYSFPYSAYQIPITFDNVDNEYATDFDVVYKLDGKEIDRVSVTGNTAVTYTVEHEISGVDEIDIEIHKWSHGTRRAMIAQIGSGRVNDMNIDFSTATAKPVVEKSSQVKTVTVNCYSYVPAADTTELYHADITLDGDVTLNVSHDAATEITATLSAGTIVSQTHYTYYSVLTLTGTGAATLSITGKVLTAASVSVVKQLNSQGEDKTALTNPLITDLTNAQNTAVWIADYFSKRNFLTTDYRGNPEIDAHDLVYMESQFEPLFPVRIMEHKIDFNGALSGTVKAVKMN